VLALVGDHERQKLIKHTLQGVDFEFVWGLSMKTLFPNISAIADLPDEFIEKYNINREEVSHWTLGALGCAIGHRNIHKRIVDNKVQTALILEDDVYEKHSKKFNIENYLLNIPKDWELIYFGFIFPTKLMRLTFLPLNVKRFYALITRMKVLKFIAYDKNHNFFPSNENKYYQKSGVYIGAHAYALTYTSAKQLLHANTPLRECSDILIMHFVYQNRLIAYNTIQPIFYQEKSLGSNTA
jgi:glycosyl transferase family 25